MERGRRIAKRLEAGTTWVNLHFRLDPGVPFGGFKWSGIGYEWGVQGLKGWCYSQSFWVGKESVGVGK